MAHINNKMLLIYGLTVFPFFVFFFVTNHAKLPQGDPNTKENVRKVNRNETRTIVTGESRSHNDNKRKCQYKEEDGKQGRSESQQT